MSDPQNSAWGRSLGGFLGGALAGPGGAAVGTLAGGLLQAILPDPLDTVKLALSEVASKGIQKTGAHILSNLTRDQKQIINHDLQTAFRAFGSDPAGE